MNAVIVALILLSVASRIGASRVSVGSHEQAEAEWLQKSQRWCTSSEATVTCDSTSIIDVYSAFYSRAWKNKCTLVPGSGEESCGVNVTDRVAAKCQGHRECRLPASFHPSCSEEPHYSIRIVWDCAAGDPATAEEDIQHVEANVDTPPIGAPEDVQSASAPTDATSPHAPEAPIGTPSDIVEAPVGGQPADWDSPPVADERTSADVRPPPALEDPAHKGAPPAAVGVPAGAQPDHSADGDDWDLPVAPEHPGVMQPHASINPKFRPMAGKTHDVVLKEVETEAKKLVEHPDIELSFNPCYRRKRSGILYEWLAEALTGVFTWKFMSRLTSCPSKEGCFKMAWEDGRLYEDPSEMPDREAILRANIAYGSDSWWVTFGGGIGLQRNDYHTWGVCLPKGEGVDLAVAVFNSLKEY